MSELIKYTSGEVRPPMQDRAVTKQAKKNYDETRLAAFKADASFVLAAHIMEKTAELDRFRMGIASGDPVLSEILLGIEVQAIQKASRIHNNLFSGWSL